MNAKQQRRKLRNLKQGLLKTATAKSRGDGRRCCTVQKLRPAEGKKK